jgi:hypothetical protein
MVGAKQLYFENEIKSKSKIDRDSFRRTKLGNKDISKQYKTTICKGFRFP